tara:strand:+ start:414 stop:2369 length:1956 start_codon:yes stop_codon:yes gene_type:complete
MADNILNKIMQKITDDKYNKEDILKLLNNDELKYIRPFIHSITEDSVEIKTNKIILLIKFEQSGKTKIVLDDISSSNKTISIIISDNNTLLLNATTNRAIDSELKVGKITCKADKKDEWKCYEGELDCNPIRKNRVRLDEAIQQGLIDCIIVCGNKPRFEDINAIIENNPNVNFNIWIDEADKTINKKRSKIVNNWRLHVKNVMKITMITATPFDIDMDYKKCEWIGDYFDDETILYRLDESHGEGYLSLDNAIHIEHSGFRDLSSLDETEENIDEIIQKNDIIPDDIEDFKKYNDSNKDNYYKSYLDKHAPKPGELWMIPGKREKKSHKDIENMCFGKYQGPSGKIYKIYDAYFDAVITLNGTDKNIKLYNSGNGITQNIVIQTSKRNGFGYNEEVNEWLGKWYNDNNGKKLRVAITGHICISRGITISSSYAQITHLLIPNWLCNSMANFKQLISRICGYKYYDEIGNCFEYYPYVICQQDLWDSMMKLHKICEFIIDKATDKEDTNKIIKKNDILEFIKDEDMNILQGKKDKVRWSVPCKISPNDSDYNYLNEMVNKRYNYANIIKYINDKTDISILEYKIHEITTPTENSYNKIMKPIITHYETDKQYTPSLNKNDKKANKKMCSIHFDYKNNDIYILKYNGDIIIE